MAGVGEEEAVAAEQTLGGMVARVECRCLGSKTETVGWGVWGAMESTGTQTVEVQGMRKGSRVNGPVQAANASHASDPVED